MPLWKTNTPRLFLGVLFAKGSNHFPTPVSQCFRSVAVCFSCCYSVRQPHRGNILRFKLRVLRVKPTKKNSKFLQLKSKPSHQTRVSNMLTSNTYQYLKFLICFPGLLNSLAAFNVHKSHSSVQGFAHIKRFKFKEPPVSVLFFRFSILQFVKVS